MILRGRRLTGKSLILLSMFLLAPLLAAQEVVEDGSSTSRTAPTPATAPRPSNWRNSGASAMDNEVLRRIIDKVLIDGDHNISVDAQLAEIKVFSRGHPDQGLGQGG